MKQTDEREVTLTINDFDNILFNAVVKALKIDTQTSDRQALKEAMRVTDAIMAVLTDIAAKQAKSAAGRKAAQARYAPTSAVENIAADNATGIAQAKAIAAAAVAPKPVNKGGRPRKKPLAAEPAAQQELIPTFDPKQSFEAPAAAPLPAFNGPAPAPAAPMLPKGPAQIVPPFGS